jgi:hypothetical protein
MFPECSQHVVVLALTVLKSTTNQYPSTGRFVDPLAAELAGPTAVAEVRARMVS